MTPPLFRDSSAPPAKPRWWLLLPWGHWLMLEYRRPSRSSAIGLWILFDPAAGVSLSVAPLLISFVVGYRWGQADEDH